MNEKDTDSKLMSFIESVLESIIDFIEGLF
jgi:hypothetical protein